MNRKWLLAFLIYFVFLHFVQESNAKSSCVRLAFHMVFSSAGLCDINEGSATSEDRCKSPTSGNMSFRSNIAEALCHPDVKPKQGTSRTTYNTTYLNAKGSVR